MKIGRGEFLNGDCLEVMSRIPDGSIDMIMADVPYGTTACEWDCVIPFEPFWKEIWRVCKPTAAVVLTASQPFTSNLVMSQITKFRTALIWDKKYVTGHLHTQRYPMKAHEDILVFFQKHGAYNPIATTSDEPVEKKRVSGREGGFLPTEAGVWGGEVDPVTGKRTKAYSKDKTGYPTSMVVADYDRYRVEEWHPTQKPVDLFVQLISLYSKVGDKVLDMTAGSGTTAIACEVTGRDWICIERDREIYSKAVQHVERYAPVYG